MIKAVTFDCWDTLIVDDDRCESKQKEHLRAILKEDGIEVTPEELNDAFRKENALRKKYVVEYRRTKNALQRLETILELLAVSLPLSEILSVADYCDKIALEIQPLAVPKVKQLLAVLAEEFRLAVICNTGWHSAETIKGVLSGHDLSDYFEWLSFSDEVGVAKPHPWIFEITLEALRCSPEEAVHIGDAEYSDIVGAKGARMRSILFTGINERYKDSNTADVMIEDYDELHNVLKTM